MRGLACVALAWTVPAITGTGRIKRGAEAMKKLSDVWLIGTQLAKHLQVSKTGLYRAAESGELRTSSLGCGRLATTLQEAQRWLRQSRA